MSFAAKGQVTVAVFNPPGIAREVRASYAFVERNMNLVKRYWGWEIAFFLYTISSSLSVIYIGEAQDPARRGELVLTLGIGTLVWAYLRSVFDSISEMITWERWEGTIEYTFMAPISRLTHMLGTALFSIVYGILRTAALFIALALFVDLDLSRTNFVAALVVTLVGSLSFLGIGIMASILPLWFTERGAEMTFMISAVLLLISGVYYPVSVLPDWLEPLARLSPATYFLDGIRRTVISGQGLAQLGDVLLPLLVMGVLSIPLGVWVFLRVETYAKRTGRLKRNG
jgi:ABC-2 type transport system permease protein